jgi:hypothetical protein
MAFWRSPSLVNDLSEYIGTNKAQLGHILVIVKFHPEGHEFPKISHKNSLPKFKNR